MINQSLTSVILVILVVILIVALQLNPVSILRSRRHLTCGPRRCCLIITRVAVMLVVITIQARILKLYFKNDRARSGIYQERRNVM